MVITDKNIDGGKSFDWGMVSSEYAKYRDIYPEEFDVIHYAAFVELKKK